MLRNVFEFALLLPRMITRELFNVDFQELYTCFGRFFTITRDMMKNLQGEKMNSFIDLGNNEQVLLNHGIRLR